MIKLRAITEIHRNPRRTMEATGRIAPDGQIEMRAVGLNHKPGEIFAVDDPAEAAWLVENRAAVPAEAHEEVTAPADDPSDRLCALGNTPA